MIKSVIAIAVMAAVAASAQEKRSEPLKTPEAAELARKANETGKSVTGELSKTKADERAAGTVIKGSPRASAPAVTSTNNAAASASGIRGRVAIPASGSDPVLAATLKQSLAAIQAEAHRPATQMETRVVEVLGAANVVEHKAGLRESSVSPKKIADVLVEANETEESGILLNFQSALASLQAGKAKTFYQALEQSSVQRAISDAKSKGETDLASVEAKAKEDAGRCAARGI